MENFHDFNIFEYNVNCHLKEITLKLNEPHGTGEGVIIFSGVIGHRFENVLEGNVILALEELNSNEFYNSFESQVQYYQKWGLPMRFKTKEEFICESVQMELKFFSISTSYGLSGWVICNEVAIDA